MEITRKKDLNPNPIEQFKLWYKEVNAQENVELPSAFCLSTMGTDGIPEGRMLLLKDVDEHGFVFYSNQNSPKGKALKKYPQASITFYWEKLRKQIRIIGDISLTTEKEADEYFASRPRDSQIGAWASEQSSVLESREELEGRFKEFEKKYEGQDVPRPSHWIGYRLQPKKIEFWVERPYRLHDRFLYTLKDGVWNLERLAP